jgi:hypothetical protein
MIPVVLQFARWLRIADYNDVDFSSVSPEGFFGPFAASHRYYSVLVGIPGERGIAEASGAQANCQREAGRARKARSGKDRQEDT